MFPLIILILLSLLGTYTVHADSKTQDYVSSTDDGKLPSKCERYSGTICKNYLGNQFVYVRPLQGQTKNEMYMRALFGILPQYISEQCQPYAIPALCLSTFPLCDLTVKYPKPRMFCQDECRVMQQYICAHEFSSTHAKYLTSLVVPCWKLPGVDSPEHKKCVHLNLTIANLELKQELKNETVKVGETVVLKCKLKSTKLAPTITWYKDGTIIQPGHAFYKIHLFRHSSRMKIRRIRAEDSGKYTCHSSNFVSNISTHSWVTVLSGKDNQLSKMPDNGNQTSCGFIGSRGICAAYLKGKKIYFHDSQKQHKRELLIRNALSKSNLSKSCQRLATAALCYHMFPSCAKGKTMKHRLCKEDCLQVKKKVCKNQLPDIFPVCSGLPKRKGRKGKHCDKLKDSFKTPEGITTVDNTVCGKYNGNGFCGQYIQNESIYFYDMGYQYQLEQTISISLKNIPISEKCKRYGFPALCYHLFPVCSHNKRRSRLCQGECTKLKTNICRSEVSLIKKVSEEHLKALFPDCPSLPRVNTEDGAHCVELGIPGKVLDESIPIENVTVYDMDETSRKYVPLQNVVVYDASHKCYNDSGSSYLGTANVTVFGHFCISWSIRRPNIGWKHNFCRNPEPHAKSPWCYVNKKGRREYCAVDECDYRAKSKETTFLKKLHGGNGEGTSLGRTIYVVIAIVAVILLGCITVIVYWKVQNSKENVDNSPQNSAAPFAKCSSTQLTDARENTSVQSFVLNEKLTRGRVKYVSVISEGKFFRVFRGVLINDQNKPNMDIVIKTLSTDASTMEKDAFRRETNLLCPLQHMNILGLLGISPGEGTEFVVFEYLSEVNLHQYLKQAQEINLSTDILFNVARQIANGMKYLSEFGYVHGDLAARNCFIAADGANLAVKISLLGMGSHKYPSDYDWLHQKNALFPIRWMSPQALDSHVLSSQNDVWSFGVLLWEIFSHGRKPYVQCSNAEAIEKIRAHELLQCPDHWPQTVRNLMNICWSIEPSLRPNFVTIYEILNYQRLEEVQV